MKLKKINTDRILGISAMLISLLTLIIFIYQTDIMRKQSKLSVKPRLDFSTIQSGNDSIVVFKQVVMNKGLGPAIIDSIYYIYKDTHYSLDIQSLVQKELPNLLEYGELSQHATMGRGSTLSEGEEQSLFTYKMPVRNLQNVLDYLDITIEDDAPFPVEVIYTSIYEDEHWIVNSNQDEPLTMD